MTLCFLIRHARHAGRPGHLTGRLNPSLSREGKEQATSLARAFKSARLTHVISSPERRALETAALIAETSDLKIEISYALDEIDYGAWTGRSFLDLMDDPMYLEWIEHRASEHPPGGECMRDVQARVIANLIAFSAKNPRGRAAMISHAEPIRAAELFCRGIGLDMWQVIEIPEASVTTIAIGESGQMVVSKAAA